MRRAPHDVSVQALDPRFDEFRDGCSWLAGLDVPKVALPQDDYDHAELLDEWLAELRVTDVLCASATPS